jgi:hypothetical protein
MKSTGTSFADQLADVLIHEALIAGNDAKMWNAVTNLIVPEYVFRNDVSQMPNCIKLSIGILLLGTERKDLLPSTYVMLR